MVLPPGATWNMETGRHGNRTRRFSPRIRYRVNLRRARPYLMVVPEHGKEPSRCHLPTPAALRNRRGAMSAGRHMPGGLPEWSLPTALRPVPVHYDEPGTPVLRRDGFAAAGESGML